MSLHIHCPTDAAVLILAVPCPDGLLRFPSDNDVVPGLFLEVKPRAVINDLLAERVHKLAPAEGSTLRIWQDYSCNLVLANERPATMYVARLDIDIEILNRIPWAEWSTLPVLIRRMPKDRNRLAYLKAWQVLTGALEESTKALDVQEVVKHLKSMEADKG